MINVTEEWCMKMARLEEAAEKTRTGYMCMIDFDHELGVQAVTPSKVYTTEEDLVRAHDCARDCGIVEVVVTLKRVVCEPEFDLPNGNGYTGELRNGAT